MTNIKNNAFCPLPWTGIFVQPDGVVKNCAISGEVLGNIHSNTIEEIVNSDVNKKIKQDMIDGVRHQRCRSCYKIDDLAEDLETSVSNRSWYNKMHESIDESFFYSVNNFRLSVLDLRWRNTCNQACIYCGPDLSSLWSFYTGANISINEDVLKQSKQYIFDNIKTIKHVYLAGGEPLLTKDNQVLLELLLKENPDVDLRVNTNLSNLDNPIFRLLESFNNVKWTISVDSTHDQYHYMRNPGNWIQFESNLKYLLDKSFNSINLNMVWCVLNHKSIFECFDYLMSIGVHENMFIVQNLLSPRFLHIGNLPSETIKELDTEIQRRLKIHNPEYWLHKSLLSMENFISTPFQHANLDLVFDKIKVYDEARNLSSEKIFPDLYKLKK